MFSKYETVTVWPEGLSNQMRKWSSFYNYWKRVRSDDTEILLCLHWTKTYGPTMEYRIRGYPGIVVEEWGGSPKVYCCRECAWVYVSAGIFHPQDELLSLCTRAMKVPDGSLIGNELHKSREQSHPDSWHHHHVSSWTLAHWTFTQPPPTHSAAATLGKAAVLICSYY